MDGVCCTIRYYTDHSHGWYALVLHVSQRWSVWSGITYTPTRNNVQWYYTYYNNRVYTLVLYISHQYIVYIGIIHTISTHLCIYLHACVCFCVRICVLVLLMVLWALSGLKRVVSFAWAPGDVMVNMYIADGVLRIYGATGGALKFVWAMNGTMSNMVSHWCSFEHCLRHNIFSNAWVPGIAVSTMWSTSGVLSNVWATGVVIRTV